jgi:hypothetical protein
LGEVHDEGVGYLGRTSPRTPSRRRGGRQFGVLVRFASMTTSRPSLSSEQVDAAACVLPVAELLGDDEQITVEDRDASRSSRCRSWRSRSARTPNPTGARACRPLGDLVRGHEAVPLTRATHGSGEVGRPGRAAAYRDALNVRSAWQVGRSPVVWAPCQTPSTTCLWGTPRRSTRTRRSFTGAEPPRRSPCPAPPQGAPFPPCRCRLGHGGRITEGQQ